jgi:hypothetical protein
LQTNNGISTCNTCATYIANCATCSSQTQCNSCLNNGYILQTTNGISTCNTCATYIANCATCSSQTVCLSCNYPLTINSLFTSCIYSNTDCLLGCKYCSDQKFCY